MKIFWMAFRDIIAAAAALMSNKRDSLMFL